MFGTKDEYADKWQMKPFTACCDVLYGYPFNSELFNDDGEGMPLIRVRDINTGFSNTYTTEDVSSIYQVHDGDILVGMDGDFNAKVWSSGTALLNQRTCKMKGKEGIVNDLFMLHYLNPELLKIHRNTASTTVKHLSAKEINKMQMPLPPKELQDQFAAFVEQVDKSKVVSSTIIKSRFIEMFGTSSNPKYGHVKVAELVSNKIVKVSKQYNSDDIIQYIDISSIAKESKTITGTTEYLVKDAPSRAQQCVQSGDILLSNVRPNLKTMAIVDSDEDNLVCSSGFTVLRCEKSEPEFLITAILDDHYTDELMKKANGSSYPAVTSKDVLNGLIPSAPIELQQSFSSFAKQVDKSKFELQKHFENTKRLQKALVNEAFKQ